VATGIAAVMMLTVGVVTASDRFSWRDREHRLSHPILRVLREGASNIGVYGDPVAGATTATAAGRTWIEKHGGMFGVANLDLRPERETALGSGGATVLAYRQYIAGLPVEGGIARLLVTDGQTHFVTYAGAKLASVPKGGFLPDRFTGAEAVDAVRRSQAYGHLAMWTAPALVVFQNDLDGLRAVPIRAWKFQGFDSDTATTEAYTFFVNAADGTLAYARNEIYHESEPDITGTVSAWASPGTLPQAGGRRRVVLPIADHWLKTDDVQTNDGQVAVTGADGSYAFDAVAAPPVTVTSELEGPWVQIVDETGPTLSLVETADTLPATVDFLHNDARQVETTAQVDAFIHANNTHAFFKTRQPAFTAIDIQLPARVNRPANCNAFFTPIGPSINFLSEGSGCVNSAYSSVVAHEYSHFVVDSLRLAQGPFGEGFADTVSELMYDDPIIGRDFFGPDTFVRDIAGANAQFPCFDEPHACGQVLAGVWWDLKLQMQTELGDADGLEYTRQLLVDWAMVTVGGSIFNAAHRQTALEVLVVADDNGTLIDGTPYDTQICAAFAMHNIPCPEFCADVRRVRNSCRGDGDGTYTVRTTISSDSANGVELRLTLDGDNVQDLDVGLFGRTVARWENVGAGTHEVCVDGCNVVCEDVVCQP